MCVFGAYVSLCLLTWIFDIKGSNGPGGNFLDLETKLTILVSDIVT